MPDKPNTVSQYIDALPAERKVAFEQLRASVANNLPKGFNEEISYGMIGFVVPHSLYPAGYHCSPKLPLPFVSIANQKGFIALYHMGIYADVALYDWFVANYPKHSKSKLDMGKSCMRFKKMEDIPFDLIGELMQKMSPQNWIELYEKNYKK